ncbi:MAG: isopentenyl-diphosphate Delta-isomerase [Bacteroidetes bacterium]|nr:isopentenyl-diphosphate Delta-isomerase [Bacteroidota bacterium]
MAEKVILVDEKDNMIGEMEKMEAHEKGLLHRAFSIFVFNEQDEMLIQQRAIKKYHSGGLWTNTCCSHPRKGESDEAAAHRRLMEEMGFDCPLIEAFSFTYQAEFGNGLTEHEFDHVFIGYYNEAPAINKDEVEDYQWLSLAETEKQIEEMPEKFTEWFKLIFHKLKDFYADNRKSKKQSI